MSNKERCVHGVFLTHRCRDCENEESNDPSFQKDAKIFQLENELKDALERIHELEDINRAGILVGEGLVSRIDELEKETKFLKRCIVAYVTELDRGENYTPEQALEVFTQGRS